LFVDEYSNITKLKVAINQGNTRIFVIQCQRQINSQRGTARPPFGL
jgi:hypothetical protein